MINGFLNGISPFATYPQPAPAAGEYETWTKPPESEASYLALSPDEPQIEVGEPGYLDVIRNVISYIPSKIAGLAGQDTSRTISKETLQRVEEYLQRNDLGHVKVFANVYKPGMVWNRTFSNPRLMTVTKLFSGSMNALMQTLFPQKALLAGINLYDQYTDAITLSNNDISMALFACAQAKATAMRRNPILYNAAKDFLPAATPIGNLNASMDVIHYLQKYGTQEEVEKAIKLQSASTGVGFGIDIMQSMSTLGLLAKAAFSTPTVYSCYKEGPSQKLFSWINQFNPAWIQRMYKNSPLAFCAELEIYGQNLNNPQQSLLYDNAKSIAVIAACAFIGYQYGTYKVAEMQKSLEESKNTAEPALA